MHDQELYALIDGEASPFEGAPPGVRRAAAAVLAVPPPLEMGAGVAGGRRAAASVLDSANPSTPGGAGVPPPLEMYSASTPAETAVEMYAAGTRSRHRYAPQSEAAAAAAVVARAQAQHHVGARPARASPPTQHTRSPGVLDAEDAVRASRAQQPLKTSPYVAA